MSRLSLEHIQLPVQWMLENHSPWVQSLECEMDHSPESSTDIKNAWKCASLFTLHSVVALPLLIDSGQ